MKCYVLYDPADGRIINRLMFSDEYQAPDIYKNLLEITNAEADARPEIHKRVNLETRTLEDKPTE